jgi:hypothetical protein
MCELMGEAKERQRVVSSDLDETPNQPAFVTVEEPDVNT